MIVKQVREVKQFLPATAQCEFEVELKETWGERYREEYLARMRAKGWDPEKCANGSSYEVDGHKYCRVHAGKVLLDGVCDGTFEIKKIEKQGDCSKEKCDWHTLPDNTSICRHCLAKVPF